MKISASVYAYKSADSLQDIVRGLDDLYIDRFHIDCKDDVSVFDDIAQIRSISSTPIDLHIITPTPEKYYDLIDKYGVDYVQFQYEPLDGAPLNPPQNGVTKWGLGICSDTPIDVFDNYAHLDFILFMATIPGESGGKFDKSNFMRMRHFRRKYQNKMIFVDGGVNGEVAFVLRNIGVSSVVCGSFLANNASPARALLDLRVNDVESQYQIADFMNDSIPVLPLHGATVELVLEEIERFGLGFVVFTNPDGTMAGIASNADVRRAFLAHSDDYNRVTVEDMINRTPFVLRRELTIAEMLHEIKCQNFVVNFFPVVDVENRPVGAVTFFNLIRSEI